MKAWKPAKTLKMALTKPAFVVAERTLMRRVTLPLIGIGLLARAVFLRPSRSPEPQNEHLSRLGLRTRVRARLPLQIRTRVRPRLPVRARARLA